MPKQHFFYRKNGCLKKIDIDEIIYLAADNNYTTFQEMNNYHYVRITLVVALSLLPENKFQRIHRSYAVSLDYVDVVKRDTVKFKSIPDLELPVSRQYYVQLTREVVILDTAATDQVEATEEVKPHHKLLRPAKKQKAGLKLKDKD
jgi:DNA-binding LytR/AlgR family response regulator